MTMQKTQNGKWTDLNSMYQDNPEATNEKSKRLGRILNSNYKQEYFEQEVIKPTHLIKLQRVILPGCLKSYEDTFNVNILSGPDHNQKYL